MTSQAFESSRHLATPMKEENTRVTRRIIIIIIIIIIILRVADKHGRVSNDVACRRIK